jgi:hypothetical protein
MKPLTTPHFELIAYAVRASRIDDGRAALLDRRYAEQSALTAKFLADALATTNPRFDRAKFLAACGVVS